MQIKSRPKSASGWIVLIALIGLTGLLILSGIEPSRAQPAPRFQFEVARSRFIQGLSIGAYPFGGMAVHPRGMIYLPDGLAAIRILNFDLEETGQFALDKAYSVAVSRAADRVYASARYPLQIRIFSPDGTPNGTFYSRDAAVLNVIAVSPDDTVYLAWQTLDNPSNHFLTAVDRDGKELFTESITGATSGDSFVHSITFTDDAEDPVVLAISGFSGDPNILRTRRLDRNGLPSPRRVAAYPRYALPAPGAGLHLRDNKLVLLSGYGLNFFDTNGQQIHYQDNVVGGFLTLNRKRGGLALAAMPDGVAFLYAQTADNNEVYLALVRLVPTDGATQTPFLPTLPPTPAATEQELSG